MKAVQKFTPEYLERCKAMSPSEIIEFLDQFRQLHGARLAKQNPPEEQRKRWLAIEQTSPTS